MEEKKIAVVSGASSGIGRETAVMLRDKGYKVYGINRKPVEIEGITFVCADITDTEAVNAAVAQILSLEKQIDLLVCNAGMGISGSFENTEDKDAKYIFDVNFFGAFRLARAVIPSMRKAGGGRIINVSSLAAIFYLPFQGFYSATKAGVSSLFNALAIEVRPFNIQVTNVLPGDVKTGFTAARVKNAADAPDYGERIARSVAVMEHDEQNGMLPSAIAAAIVKTAGKRRQPLRVLIGCKYKFLAFLLKILPEGLVNRAIGAIYG